MKICEIHDDFRNIVIGYLYYYENNDSYLIELSEALSPDEVPVFFEYFIRNHIYTVNAEWSHKYVQSRVVPRDRQNLGEILKNAGLKTYDMFKLLMLSAGKCSQDDCSIHIVNGIPSWLDERKKKWLRNAAPLSEFRLFVSFEDGCNRIIDMHDIFDNDRTLAVLLEREDDFKRVELRGSGRYLDYGAGREVMYDKLYPAGEKLQLSNDVLETVFKNSYVDISFICDKYTVSKQYVNKKLQAKGVSPVMKSGTGYIYNKSDIYKVFEK